MILMKEVMEGKLSVTEGLAQALLRCTTCMNCTLSCPSGADPQEVIKAMRKEMVGMGYDNLFKTLGEVVEKYGSMNDWKNSVGSGPFMLTDYVKGSSATLVRNPNYWEKDPVGPGKGNQLPYLDGVRTLIEPDASTQDSLFTTGHVDIINVEYDRAQAIKSSCPDAKYVKSHRES
jgi:ferredoxin